MSFAVDFEEVRVCIPERAGPFAVQGKMFLEKVVAVFCSRRGGLVYIDRDFRKLLMIKAGIKLRVRAGRQLNI